MLLPLQTISFSSSQNQNHLAPLSDVLVCALAVCNSQPGQNCVSAQTYKQMSHSIPNHLACYFLLSQTVCESNMSVIYLTVICKGPFHCCFDTDRYTHRNVWSYKIVMWVSAFGECWYQSSNLVHDLTWHLGHSNGLKSRFEYLISVAYRKNIYQLPIFVQS
ncbi:hypothetical protein NPIL_475791 [Nephila pilipes]|uniref:Uncharacterized protein n=1 Tax=Nephila pilipes TaxID=299642 RepID=A0A8X6ME86_NEPPI|nr:hypothetical protein NPIL_475791 [Nephila pilipes]